MVPLLQGQRIDFTDAVNITHEATEEEPIPDLDTELQWLKEDEEFYRHYREQKRKEKAEEGK